MYLNKKLRSMAAILTAFAMLPSVAAAAEAPLTADGEAAEVIGVETVDEETADEESTDEESADEESADEESADEESTDEESTDEEAADEEAADEESADEEAADEEATNEEATDEEAADEEEEDDEEPVDLGYLEWLNDQEEAARRMAEREEKSFDPSDEASEEEFLPDADLAGFAVEINATNFPDETIRNKILQCDYDKDGVLSETEMNSLGSYFSIYGGTVTSFKGLELLPKITSLNISGITTSAALTISGMKNLDYFYAYNLTGLTSLKIQNCPNLREIYANNNKTLATLDVTGCPYVEEIDIYNCAVKSFDTSGFRYLDDYYVSNCPGLIPDLTNNPYMELGNFSCYGSINECIGAKTTTYDLTKLAAKYGLNASKIVSTGNCTLNKSAKTISDFRSEWLYVYYDVGQGQQMTIYLYVSDLLPPSITRSTDSNGNSKIKWNLISGATSYRIYTTDDTMKKAKLIKEIAASDYDGDYIDIDFGNAVYFCVTAYSSKLKSESPKSWYNLQSGTSIYANYRETERTEEGFTFRWGYSNTTVEPYKFRIYRMLGIDKDTESDASRYVYYNDLTEYYTLLATVLAADVKIPNAPTYGVQYEYTDKTIGSRDAWYTVFALDKSGNIIGRDSTGFSTLDKNRPSLSEVTGADDRAVIRWYNASTEVTKYNIYRAERRRGTKTLIGSVAPQSGSYTTYEDTNVTKGDKYYYFVTSVYGKKESGYSSAYRNSAIIGKYSLSPSGVKAVPGDGRVKISWNPSASAVKYRVYSYRDGKFTVQATVNSNVLSYTVTGLTNGTKYAFLVRGYDGEQFSKYTKADFVYGTPAAAPAKPAKINAVAGAGQVTVTCSTVKGAKTYRLFYTTDNGKNYTKVGDTPDRKWVVKNLTGGVEYKFLVLASDGKVWSNFNKGDCYSAAVPGIGKPETVKSTAGKGQITVVCSTVPGAKTYRLFYTTDNGKNYKKVGDAKGRKWVVTGLKAGTTYKFLVLAYDGKKWSAYTKGECYAAAKPL